MEARLIPLNAVIALHSPTATSWPRPFFEAGYRLEGLELPIKLEDDSKVTADVVGFKRRTNSFLLHEAKSGSNIEPEQANRYARVPENYLVTALSVTLDSPDPVSAQTVYACLRQNEERILLGLDQVELNAPLLSIGPQDVHVVGVPFADPDLNAAFAAPISVPSEPPGVITVDADSPDDAFDNVVFPSLVAAMSLERQNVTIASLAEESLPYFAVYPSPYKQRLKRKIGAAARRAAESDPQHLEYRPATQSEPDGVVRILATPEQADPRGRTQQYQAIQNRFDGGRRRKPRAEMVGQESLFPGGDLEQELDSARASDIEEREEES
jgi:hypothetical protein